MSSFESLTNISITDTLLDLASLSSWCSYVTDFIWSEWLSKDADHVKYGICFLYSGLSFLLFSSIYLSFDRFPSIRRFVIRYCMVSAINDNSFRNPNELWTMKDMIAINKVIGFNFLLLGPPLYLLAYSLFKRYIRYNESLDMMTLLWEIIGCILIEEILFYSAHRLFHTSLLYRYHKLHHEYKAPNALVGAYSSPVEYVIANALPFIVSPVIIGCHYQTAVLWAWIAPFSVATTHSGYTIPGFGNKHDLHHQYFNCNYGSLLIFDLLFGTIRWK